MNKVKTKWTGNEIQELQHSMGLSDSTFGRYIGRPDVGFVRNIKDGGTENESYVERLNLIEQNLSARSHFSDEVEALEADLDLELSVICLLTGIKPSVIGRVLNAAKKGEEVSDTHRKLLKMLLLLKKKGVDLVKEVGPL